MPKRTSIEREQRWQELLDRAHTLADWCGQHVDDGIIETVVALWAHGIGTHSSCAGHVTRGAFPEVVLTGMPDA